MLRRSRLIVGILLLLLTTLTAPPALAATRTAGDEASLKAAITTANSVNDPDTILLTANITLTTAADTDAAYGDTELPAITNPLTIEGQGFTISRDSGAPAARIFRVASGASVTLLNLTLRNGYATVGTTACPFNTNAACGGGIWNDGALLLENVLVYNNTSNDVGGGLFNGSAGTLTLVNSTVSSNFTDSDGQGGGIFNKGSLFINSSIFDLNSASAGGGLNNDRSSSATINNSTFSNNSASIAIGGYGGGVANLAAITISGTTFSNNSASNGGALYNDTAGTATISNSTFSANSVNGAGGAVFNVGTATITNSTFSANQSNFGSAIRNNATVTFKNTIISKSDTADNCVNDVAGTFNGSSTDQANDATCPGFTNTSSMNLGTLADNGGGNQTFALLAGSSAIDTGDNPTCSAPPVSGFDQRGIKRGVACDIGAFEAGGTVPTVQFASDSSTAVATTGSFPVTLLMDTPLPSDSAPVSVYVSIIGGSAVAGTDYNLFGLQTVTFSPGENAKVVNIGLLNASRTLPRSITLAIANQNGLGLTGPAKLGATLTHTVTVVPVSSPAATPEVNYDLTTGTPTLTWNRILGALSYEIQVDTDTKFLAPYSYWNKTVPADQLYVTVNPPLPNGRYYWRVRANINTPTGVGVSGWSAVQTLVVNLP